MRRGVLERIVVKLGVVGSEIEPGGAIEVGWSQARGGDVARLDFGCRLVNVEHVVDEEDGDAHEDHDDREQNEHNGVALVGENLAKSS